LRVISWVFLSAQFRPLNPLVPHGS
jgi:hypothetical protein